MSKKRNIFFYLDKELAVKSKKLYVINDEISRALKKLQDLETQ